MKTRDNVLIFNFSSVSLFFAAAPSKNAFKSNLFNLKKQTIIGSYDFWTNYIWFFFLNLHNTSSPLWLEWFLDAISTAKRPVLVVQPPSQRSEACRSRPVVSTSGLRRRGSSRHSPDLGTRAGRLGSEFCASCVQFGEMNDARSENREDARTGPSEHTLPVARRKSSSDGAKWANQHVGPTRGGWMETWACPEYLLFPAFFIYVCVLCTEIPSFSQKKWVFNWIPLNWSGPASVVRRSSCWRLDTAHELETGYQHPTFLWTLGGKIQNQTQVASFLKIPTLLG